MPKEIDYQEQLRRKRTRQLRILLKDMPPACSDFMLGIADTTSALTRLNYARDLKLFFRYLECETQEFGHITTPDQWTNEQLDRVTARHIEAYQEYLGYYLNDENEEFSNGELGKMRKLSTLRSFYKYLFKNNYVSSNVTLLVDLPKRHHKPILRMELDELARMLDLAASGDAFSSSHQKSYNRKTSLRDLTILTLFLGTGIRVSELVGLNLSDIDLDNEAFLVTRKGGHQVILYFPQEVSDQLKTYLEQRQTIEALPGHEDALFLSLQRKRMGVRAVENMVKKYALQAAPLKTRLSPHKLRATYGTNLYRETGDIYLVADVLGHSDINTTRRHYADMSDERRRMAAKKVVLRGDEVSDQDPVQEL
ncbi:MAG: tyrosine-type recombinase/integrase [Clostridiales bacterium]|nr:tyrosine-type recombinase/integrase [Clostridiales bacterium]